MKLILFEFDDMARVGRVASHTISQWKVEWSYNVGFIWFTFTKGQS